MCIYVCVSMWWLAGLLSQKLVPHPPPPLSSDIFFSLTGVCGGPTNSSAHIATLTSFFSSPPLQFHFDPSNPLTHTHTHAPLHPPPISSSGHRSLCSVFICLNLSLKVKRGKKPQVERRRRKRRGEKKPARRVNLSQ